MKTPTIEDLVAAYAAGKSIRYQTETGFSELTTQKAGYPKGNPSYGFRHSSHQTEGKSLAFLTSSPEQSIRRALSEPRPGLGFRTLEIWDKVAETSAAPPAPQTIPLGKNVTRSGLRARVLANDYQQADRPVVALVQIATGSRAEKLHIYQVDGLHWQNRELDLVGHLPSEIKAPEDSELEELRRWKAKMKSLIATINLPEIAKEIGETGATDTAREILPFICDLKAKLEAAKQALQ